MQGKADTRTLFTPEELESRPWMPAFVQAIEDERGNVAAAARSVGMSRTGVYDARDEVPALARAWSEAVESQTDKIECNAVRLAADGWEEPVFHNGEQCGARRVYSATLMLGLLRKRRRDTYGEDKQDKDKSAEDIGTAVASALALMRERDGLGYGESS